MDVIDELHAVATRMIGDASGQPPPDAYVAGVHEAINAAVRLLAQPDAGHTVMVDLTDDATTATDQVPTFLRRVVVHLGRTARNLEDGQAADAANIQRIMQACDLLLLAAGSLEWQQAGTARTAIARRPATTDHDHHHRPEHGTTSEADDRQANWLAALILGIANEGPVTDRDVMEVLRLAGWSRPLVELATSKLSRVDMLRDDTRQRITELRDRAVRVATAEQPDPSSAPR